MGGVLHQQVRSPFWQRHPLTTAATAALAVWLVWTGSYTLVAVVGVAWLAVVVRTRRRAIRHRDAGLLARADYEHRLMLSGDPRGQFGRYPPVQAGWFEDPQNRCQLRYFDGAMWTGYTLRR